MGNTNNTNKPAFITTALILMLDNKYHYLCPKFYKFPFIEFTKSKQYVKFTYSCYNNKEISIKDLLDENNKLITINIRSDKSSDFFSINIAQFKENNEYEGLKCKRHGLDFKYFCKLCLSNICIKCDRDDSEPHDLIEFQSDNIDNNKLNKIISIINQNNNNNFDIKKNIKIVLNKIDDITFEKLT